VNAGVEARRGQDVVEVVPNFEVPAMKLAVFAVKENEPHTNPRLTDPDPITSLVDDRIAAAVSTFATIPNRPSENPRIARLQVQRPSRAETVARNFKTVEAELV
jgi:hypothetical protein